MLLSAPGVQALESLGFRENCEKFARAKAIMAQLSTTRRCYWTAAGPESREAHLTSLPVAVSLRDLSVLMQTFLRGGGGWQGAGGNVLAPLLEYRPHIFRMPFVACA